MPFYIHYTLTENRGSGLYGPIDTREEASRIGRLNVKADNYAGFSISEYTSQEAQKIQQEQEAQKAEVEARKQTPTPTPTPIATEPVGEQDEILNWVTNFKPWYNTPDFPYKSREEMIEEGARVYGEQYRQFIVDTIYRELRSPGEPAYQPPAYEVYGAPPGGGEGTGDLNYDKLLTLIQDVFDFLKDQGKKINENIPITAEAVAEFLTQIETDPELAKARELFMARAGEEIEPYWSGQLALARESLLRDIGYSTQEILAKETQWERQYGTAVRQLGEQMAETGFALSGIRGRAERELAIGTQEQIESARRALEYGAGTAAREYAQLWGGEAVPTTTISTAPRALPGEMGFARAGGEKALYQLSPEIYQGLIGEQQYLQKAETKTRAAQLEEAFRVTQEEGRYRAIS